MSNVIECRAISKIFKDGNNQVRVFEDLSLNVAQGESVAILGASGSGKSTLLQIMGGLDKPTAGKVMIGNKDITTLSEREMSYLRNHDLGFVYQFHHLLPEFNALENVCMPLLIRGLPKKTVIEKANDMLNQVNLSHRTKHKVGELSGGERQRVAIARALVTDPICVLADEPTGNLDQQSAHQVFDLILSLNNQLKTSFVIVTHSETLANRLNRTLYLGAN